MRKFGSTVSMTALILAGSLGAQAALAQEEERASAVDALRETIVVTGTKEAGGEALQSAPVAITAYGEDQLDALFVTDIESLSYSIPNVQLNDIGTIPGTANFSIRGVAVNSSIPSIDPAVAFVQDGIPLGINTGVIFDTFDTCAVEVLRGPQGTLFGRNATGGAVVMNSCAPTDELTIKAKAAVETGLLYRVSGVASGPVVEDLLSAKLGVMYVDDEGYWENSGASLSNPLVAPGLDQDGLGEGNQLLVRGALSFTPNDTLTITPRFEYGDTDGLIAPGQNRGLNGDVFESTVNDFGDFESEWTMLTNEITWDVPFGDGVVTNITGYREYESTSIGDIDSSPLTVFHSFAFTDHSQFSNELRYSGNFADRVGVTGGVFYMEQELTYIEDRTIPSTPLPFIGGGEQDVETLGIFAEADVSLSDTFTLILGGRYTDESKDGAAEYIFADDDCTRSGCSSFDTDTSPLLSPLEVSVSKFTPRVGLQFQPNEDVQLYASYTEGVRAGGFNFRNTGPTIPIEPFTEELAKAFEFGFKSDLFDGRLRVNAAAFQTELEDLQREINLPDVIAGVVQVIDNTADATIQGVEGEFQFVATDQLVFTGQIGLVDGEYDEIRLDLTGDGVIDQADLNLDLPRLAPQTYGLGVLFDQPLGELGNLTARANINHRSRAKYTDNNLGTFPAADILDASVGWEPAAGGFLVSLYGKNLLDEITFGNDTQLPDTFPGSSVFPVPGLNGTGATFSPLNKGRIVGLELKFEY